METNRKDLAIVKEMFNVNDEGAKTIIKEIEHLITEADISIEDYLNYIKSLRNRKYYTDQSSLQAA